MATPKLRFKEFNEDWSKTTLSDIAEINPPSSSLPDKFIYIDLESVKNGRLLAENNIELKNAPSRAQRLLQKDDVLFQVVRPYQQNNLYFEKEGSYVASTGYAQIRANANSSFLYYILHEENFLNNVINRCTGTSYPAINSKDLSSIEVYTTSLEEQTKIATFLSAVDTKIDELTHKHELLIKYKKGMMQQIFSQKLRFKADDGSDFEDWNDITLGEIAEKSLAKNKDESISEVLTNSATQGIIKQSDYFEREIVTISNLKGYYVVELGDFVYNPRISSQAPVGPIKRNKQCLGVMSPLYTVFTINEGNTTYLEYFFESSVWHDYVKSVSNSGARHDRMNIKNQDFFDMPILYPCLAEQTKIANFLTAIDQKIDNVADQIDQAKTWKKGLLQQMFV